MKKKQMSFADKAKEIKKKYPRAEWDSIERKDLAKELRELQAEQEEFRKANGMGDEQEQSGQPEEQEQGQEQQPQMNPQMMEQMMQQQGQAPQMQHGGEWDSWEDTSNHSYKMGGKFLYPKLMNRDPWHMRNYAYGGGNPDDYLNPADEANSGVNAAMSFLGQAGLQQANTPMNNYSETPVSGGSYQPMSISPVPSAIAAGASALGDIGQLIAARQNLKRNRVQFPSVVPTYINLARQREALQRNAGNATNIALANSRNVSNPSNAYANQIAGVTEVNRNLGENISQSYLNEDVQNAGVSNQASQTNASIKMQEAIQNARNRELYGQQRLGIINSIGETVPRALADYRAQVNQANLMNIMGKDYGLYQYVPGQENSWQKFLRSLTGGTTKVLPRYGQSNQG